MGITWLVLLVDHLACMSTILSQIVSTFITGNQIYTVALNTIEPLNDYSPKYHKNSKCLRLCIDQLCFINSLLQLGIDIYKFSYR